MSDLDEAIKRVKDSETAKQLIKQLLEAQQEHWKEQMVGAYGDDIVKLQGAVIHTRVLASQLSNEVETTLQEQSYI